MLPARGCLSKSDLLEPKHVKIKTLLAKNRVRGGRRFGRAPSTTKGARVGLPAGEMMRRLSTGKLIIINRLQLSSGTTRSRPVSVRGPFKAEASGKFQMDAVPASENPKNEPN